MHSFDCVGFYPALAPILPRRVVLWHWVTIEQLAAGPSGSDALARLRAVEAAPCGSRSRASASLPLGPPPLVRRNCPELQPDRPQTPPFPARRSGTSGPSCF